MANRNLTAELSAVFGALSLLPIEEWITIASALCGLICGAVAIGRTLWRVARAIYHGIRHKRNAVDITDEIFDILEDESNENETD